MLNWANFSSQLFNGLVSGALLALKSVQFDQTIQDVIERSCYVELSDDEDFVLDYVMNMDFEV